MSTTRRYACRLLAPLGAAGLLAFAPAAHAAITERVSVGPAGEQANGQSFEAAISGDGRFVAFESGATNLGTPSASIVVHDRETGTNEAVDLDAAGQRLFGSQPAISGDGRFIAFQASPAPNSFSEVFVRDRVSDITEQLTFGGFEGSSSQTPAISADGRFVAFNMARDVLAGDINRLPDVFVHDRLTRTTELVSVNSVEEQANASAGLHPGISADGRFVVFDSEATNLDPNDVSGGDVFVRDRGTGTTERVSVVPSDPASFRSSGAATISADGRFVAFGHTIIPSGQPSIFGVYVRDRNRGTTQLIATESFLPVISASARFVAFESRATDLVPGDTNGQFDVFVRDLRTGATERASVDSAGAQANGESSRAAISADGRFVSFDSTASNLVSGDTNGFRDVFVRDRGPIPAPGPPATLDLTPGAATNPVGSQHCVTATVNDSTGNPTPAVSVRFSVTGSVETSGSSATDSTGEATFCYQGPPLPGVDEIIAFADTNADGDQDPGEPAGGAQKSWAPPASTPDCSTSSRGLIIAQNGDRATFTGTARTSVTGEPAGSETYTDRGPADRVVMRSIAIDALVCDDRDASIFGQALVNGDEQSFQIDLHDGGGRRKDTYRILLGSGYDSGERNLRSGYVRIR